MWSLIVKKTLKSLSRTWHFRKTKNYHGILLRSLCNDQTLEQISLNYISLDKLKTFNLLLDVGVTRRGLYTLLLIVSFSDVLLKCRLQKRGTGGVDTASSDGTFDISNLDRLGKSEVELVQLVIDGVDLLVKMEKCLEKGMSCCRLFKSEIDKQSLYTFKIIFIQKIMI